MGHNYNVDGKTGICGLIGDPVEHTLSPVIHNSLNELLEKNSVYVPFHVKNEGLEAAVKGAYELNITGMNVTVPHKNAVCQLVTELDPAAEGIGAVNTLVRDEIKHGYRGFNTDMPGLLRAITSDGISVAGNTVIIIGAGGASKAVAYMCMQEQAEAIYVLNRTPEKAQEIAGHMNALFGENRMHALPLSAYRQFCPDESEDNRQAYIVFQCTSIGLSPNNDLTAIDDPEFYRCVKIGIDLIYNPANTRFMRYVKEAGGQAYNGLKMLLYQGIIAYEYWNDCKVSEEIAQEVYSRLYESVYPPSDNLVLIGFMGSGKTTIGRILEREYGYTMLDTDAYIEQTAGKTIKEIFDHDGEDCFRKIETEVLQKLITDTHHAVISTGGGMPLRPENARLLRQLGHVCYLRADEKTIWNRVKHDTSRPLLLCENPRERIHSLMEERDPLYQKASHAQIIVDRKKPEKLAQEIKNQVLSCKEDKV
ncbi:MAG: shikimate dehydrogenase [Lachnospiraceae bacterium]|nr:shikimate dehydrogenase [Lachnospiraceae bacterium]